MACCPRAGSVSSLRKRRRTSLPAQYPPTRIAIALGSNLGDRLTYLTQGIQSLRGSGALSQIAVSSFIETEPEGVIGQPPFLNGALTAETHLEPRQLLELLLEIEHRLGRV